MNHLTSLFFIFLGGGLGSVSRFIVAQFFESILKPLTGTFPYSTFVINVFGSFVIGCIVSLAGEKIAVLSKELRLLLGVGFCGGFTTFSAFSLENITLIQSGKYTVFLLYSFGSVVAGIIACVAGITLTHYLAKRWFIV